MEAAAVVAAEAAVVVAASAAVARWKCTIGFSGTSSGDVCISQDLIRLEAYITMVTQTNISKHSGDQQKGMDDNDCKGLEIS